MRTTPRFVTPIDFKNYFGIDLDERLRPSDNEGNKANIFLNIVEDRFLNWVDLNCFRNYQWEDLTGDDLEALQKAILTQAYYVYYNSDIGTDSGYDPDKGIIADKRELERIKICDDAVNFLRDAGLFSHVMNNYRRHTSFN